MRMRARPSTTRQQRLRFPGCRRDRGHGGRLRRGRPASRSALWHPRRSVEPLGHPIISSAAAAASALVGGLSHNVATYIVAALILGVYFAMNSGTVDSVVYDTV